MKHYNRTQYRHETYKIYGLCGVIIFVICLLGIGGYYVWKMPHHNNFVQMNHHAQITKSNRPIQLPNRLLHSKSVSHSQFVKIATPKELRGTFIIYRPLHQIGLSQYYKVGTIIKFTRNDIYEQCLLLPRKPIHFKVQSASNTSAQRGRWLAYEQHLNDIIPLNVKEQVNNELLFPRISNFNYDGQPGNLTQSGNTFHLQTRLQTMVSNQSLKQEFKSLASVIPDISVILPIKPSFQNTLNVTKINKKSLRVNGHLYKRISNKQASQFCNESNVHPYFIGLGTEHVIDKR